MSSRKPKGRAEQPDVSVQIDEYGTPYVELSPDLRRRVDLHDWEPATSGKSTCARCGTTTTLDTLPEVGACLS